MLGADVPVAEFVRDGNRLVEHYPRARRIGQIRQMRLVAAERAEALRMRIFLDRARTREGQRAVNSGQWE